jgi:5'(3')-deoxyribonucleotidase
MTNSPNILLDMDGVMVDFVGAAIKVCGFSVEDCFRDWPPGEYDVIKALHVEKKDFWEKIESKGEELWANLSSYPWARSLYDGCSKLGNVFFLTKPTIDPKSASGKVIWMQKFLGGQFEARKYLMGPSKHLCGKPGNILIDDYEYNIDTFREAGGQAILFPQHWNKRHHQADDVRCELVLRELESLVLG